MAYPFTRMPTLGEFLDVAVSNGCRRVAVRGELVGPRGVVLARGLQKGHRPPVVLPDIATDEHLTPTMLQFLCRRLDLDPGLFNL